MREIILSTETGSDLTREMAERYHIHIVPMHVVMNGESCPDGCDFPIEDIYRYYERTRNVPSTSAVNVGEYIDFFRTIQAEHPDCVIMHFAYSSNASSSCRNAIIATEEVSDVYVIDTKQVTAGCIAYIVAAYELIQQKKGLTTDYSALADELRAIAPRTACAFIPGNLDYLKAGGRVSNAAYLGATILQLKPLIEIDAEGFLVAGKKYQGSMKRIAPRFVREFVARHDLNRAALYMNYTRGVTDEVLSTVEKTARDLGFGSCIRVQVGGVITCHSGPGAIGLAGISD